MRNVQLPKHLTSFELHMNEFSRVDYSVSLPYPTVNVVFYSEMFPLNLELNFISVYFKISKCTIVVDDWVGAGVESVKAKIHIPRRVPLWILCDHDYSGLENNLF
ncbi:unnamed protein product [Ambrosiozyma monospora]|uniref:Unnamed protein product n=1 Tax=Ambrosiozyma monospora TaxID=43982 RepID=A0ACB5UDX4_AMBMO|nr:unnamed protein product [Ambrosiozyma monospora]